MLKDLHSLLTELAKNGLDCRLSYANKSLLEQSHAKNGNTWHKSSHSAAFLRKSVDFPLLRHVQGRPYVMSPDNYTLNAGRVATALAAVKAALRAEMSEELKALQANPVYKPRSATTSPLSPAERVLLAEVLAASWSDVEGQSSLNVPPALAAAVAASTGCQRELSTTDNFS